MNQQPIPLNQAPVSNQTRIDTWKLIFDLERNVRYHTVLGDRYALRYRAIRFILLFGILAEAVAIYFLSGQPKFLWAFVGLATAAIGYLTVFDAATNYAETAATLRSAARQCDYLKTQAQRLWRDIEAYRISDTQAEQHYQEIVSQWAQATSAVNLEVHQNDNIKAAEEACTILTTKHEA